MRTKAMRMRSDHRLGDRGGAAMNASYGALSALKGAFIGPYLPQAEGTRRRSSCSTGLRRRAVRSGALRIRVK